MKRRSYNSDLACSQEKLRKLLISVFFEFDVSNIQEILDEEKAVNKELDKLIKATKGYSDENFFKYYGYFISSIYHLVKWAQMEMNADDGSKHLKASSTQVQQIDFSYFDYIPDFRDSIQTICNLIEQITAVKNLKGLIASFLNLSFPTILTFINDPYQNTKGDSFSESAKEKARIIMVSLQLSIDGEPWANPQILKPEELYSIKGTISLNKWPEGYDSLILKPVSTSDSDWFSISIPEIKKENKTKYEIIGNVVFKYPQSTFDSFISIRLLGYFQNSQGAIEYPTIIGYDQLILKVLDPNSSPFITGFKKMNKVVMDTAIAIENQLEDVDKTEKENFLLLLTGILNYQGYCSQQGIFKGKSSLIEDDFRDLLIQHLIGLTYLGEEITKEAHLAGGRVEIGFRGLIAELKVENKISDRTKLFAKYGKQPVAYASGNSKQLSILCILDLTEKKLPPAVPQNSIQLLTPKVHGFENVEPDYPSRVVMVVIDGNTKKPSEYSK